MKKCFEAYNCHQSLSEKSHLPNNVLEVEVFGSSKTVKLKETEGEYGDYLCLSHYWGQPLKTLNTTQQISTT